MIKPPILIKQKRLGLFVRSTNARQFVGLFFFVSIQRVLAYQLFCQLYAGTRKKIKGLGEDRAHIIG